MLDPQHLTVYGIIALALGFDYINGFHDAANSIATVVSTRVLSPKAAVVWAAFFNFVAFMVFKLGVATTIGKGTVDHTQVNVAVVTAGLVGAITWNLITWFYGIPSSSSHALVGGFAGAAVAKVGSLKVLLPAGLIKIGVFIIVAPFVGLTLGFILMIITYWVCRRFPPAKVSSIFRKLQLLSAAFYSLGHGGNDAQKTMGIIFVLLLAAGRPNPAIWQSTDYQVTGAVLSELRKNEVSEATLDALKSLEEKKRITGRESFVHEVEARLPGIDAR